MSRRLDHIDAMRGLAALLVLGQHTAEAALDPLGGIPPQLDWINFGRLGVELFFLISGYVVPFSLRGPTPLRSFAAGRAFRLLPALWVSIAVALAIKGMEPAPVILANMAMVALPLGLPEICGAYWTLTVELAFYLMIAAIFASGRLRDPELIGAITVLIALVGGILVIERLAVFAYFFTGLLLRLAIEEQVPGARKWAAVGCGTLIVLPLVLYLRLPLVWTGDPLPITTAALLALAIFVAGVLIRPAVPRWAVWSGTISYSIYLFHDPAIVALLPLRELSPLGFAIAMPLTTLAVAAIVQRWIEVPFIRLGRDLMLSEPRRAAA